MCTALRRRLTGRMLRILAACSGALLASAPPLHAQGQPGGAVAGRVTDARSGQPVAGATVEIAGQRLSVITAPDGRYRIANVPAGTHSIAARRLGYAQTRLQATVEAGGQVTLDFTLQPSAVSLEQVVVTGTAGGEQLRSIGNAVSTIDAVDKLALSAAPDLGSLLNARAPGVVILQGTGRLGAGPAINIRGRSSIGLGNSPLIYIDGVRVNNAVSTGPISAGGLGGQGSQVAGRLNDLTPEDIERIEIIKGPAASTIYGTEASNGVVQIITKKGAAGARPSFSLSVQEGSIYFRDAEGRIPTNYFRDPSTNEVVAWNAVRAEEDRGTPMFRTGETQLVNGAIAGGRDDLRYYISSAYQRDKGIERNNTLRQFSTHANFGVALSPKLDVSTSLNYVDLRSRLGMDFGASSMFGAMFGHALLWPNSRGFGLGFVPELTQDYWDNVSDVARFTASGTVSHTPATWFRQRLVMGVDYTGDESRALERFVPPPLSSLVTASTAGGRIGQTLRRGVGITGDYSATGTFTVTPTLSQSTSAGVQVFRTEAVTSFLGGIGFPGQGIETVSGTALPVPSTESRSLNTTVGAYLQEKLSWRERLYLTAAVRVDNNSAFGDDFKWVAYPKFDVSWVAHEESFFPWRDLFSTLRLRAAYGESGRQPATFSALRTFSPIQGPGGSNAVTPGNIGNPDLRPERGKEIELGFEAGLLSRFNLDFTYFSKRTTDLIVNQPVAPSSGFSGSRPLNLGRVDTRGMELSATARVLERDPVQWEVTGTVATNRDEIKDLGGTPSAMANYGFYNKVGYPIGGIFSRRIVSADRDPVTQGATNVLCDDGNGGSVACATAPFVFIGTTSPKTTGAVTNTFTVARRLRLFAMVDFKRGHKLLNANEVLRCSGALGAGLCESNYYPERYDPKYLAATAGNTLALSTVDQFFQNASFVKLRELSASYSLPERWIAGAGASAASITLAARELHTWTDYNGIDPEANSFSPAGVSAQDQAMVPPLSRLILTLNVRF